ncbi:MAG: hypothetical protein AAB966_03635 [Patescibacteria group bacterium]
MPPGWMEREDFEEYLSEGKGYCCRVREFYEQKKAEYAAGLKKQAEEAAAAKNLPD